jgi:VanZ family protein
MKVVSFLPAITWFLISVVLLALPGDDVPSIDYFDIPYFDKLIHLGMFFLLSFLFCYPLVKSSAEQGFITSWCNRIAVLAIIYGVFMEFVQRDFVRGRSFDVIDILFDTIGSIAGVIAVRQYYRKKIGPDGNQGRNQN